MLKMTISQNGTALLCKKKMQEDLFKQFILNFIPESLLFVSEILAYIFIISTLKRALTELTVWLSIWLLIANLSVRLLITNLSVWLLTKTTLAETTLAKTTLSVLSKSSLTNSNRNEKYIRENYLNKFHFFFFFQFLLVDDGGDVVAWHMQPMQAIGMRRLTKRIEKTELV